MSSAHGRGREGSNPWFIFLLLLAAGGGTGGAVLLLAAMPRGSAPLPLVGTVTEPAARDQFTALGLGLVLGALGLALMLALACGILWEINRELSRAPQRAAEVRRG